MEKDRAKVKGDFFHFRGVRIEKRLKKAFDLVTVISSCVSTIGLIALIVVTSNFKSAMNNYALPQGDIALFMNEYAECRSNTRGIIGYDDQALVDSLLKKHAMRKENTYNRLATIEKTMVTPEGKAAYKEIKMALEAYFAVEAEIIELGSSSDPQMHLVAQERAINEMAPLYEALDTVTLHLMEINIEKEHEMEAVCNILEYGAIILMTTLVLSIVAIAKRVSTIIAHGISQPLNELSNRLVAFEKGDIASPFPDYHDDDEVGDMVSVVSATTSKLQKIFADLEYLLNEMAGGNFQLKTACEEEYIGEYEGLLLAIRQMNRKMDAALKDVRSSSQMVLAGSVNLAEAAQALAEGATDQAASIEEMQATMDELTGGLERCKDDMNGAYRKAEECASAAESSQVEMSSMVSTMERISDTSSQIQSIIADIEDIASQTNLLSLNAAIEAARAGDAGKGFAVVADQIRTLAEQSAKSAVNTRDLIESSVREINAGSEAALNTAKVLEGVVTSVKDIADLSKELSENIKLQVDSIEQANEGINRISEVVQSNSATAQESSATSEELSAQATSMDELVSRFKLRE